MLTTLIVLSLHIYHLIYEDIDINPCTLYVAIGLLLSALVDTTAPVWLVLLLLAPYVVVIIISALVAGMVMYHGMMATE
jgi:hypothetical protein